MDSPLSWQRLFIAVMLTLFTATVWAAVPNKSAVPAYAEEQTIMQQEKQTPEPGWLSPDSGKRHLDRHYIVPPGLMPEQDVVLQRGGNTWRVLRNGPLATITGTLLLVVPFLLLIFYKSVGPARPVPESGRRIQRFTAWERPVHWTTAITFVILALTGIIVMFGKLILIPLIGHVAFSWVAIISKYLHNFIGPLFIIASILMFFSFLHRNFFRHWDWNWIKKGGGLVSHKHVPAGFFNAGEKVWFWGGVVVLGLIMSISGLMMNFPYFLNAGPDVGMTRYMLQWANYFHIGAGALYMAFTMGHAYIGTAGTPGAYEAMRHGTVDEEWARQHHEIWFNELNGIPNPERPPRSPDSTAGDPVTPRGHG